MDLGEAASYPAGRAAGRIALEGGNAMPAIRTAFLFKIVLAVPTILDLGGTVRA